MRIFPPIRRVDRRPVVMRHHLLNAKLQRARQSLKMSLVIWMPLSPPLGTTPGLNLYLVYFQCHTRILMVVVTGLVRGAFPSLPGAFPQALWRFRLRLGCACRDR